MENGLPVQVHRLDTLVDADAPHACFRLWLLTAGSAVIESAAGAAALTAPAVISLDQAEGLAARAQGGITALLLRFEPSVVNSAFSLDALADRRGFTRSETLDLYWLGAFLDHGGARPFFRMVGPDSARRLEIALDQLDRELRDQDDDLWPCKSRASLLAILGLLNAIRERPLPYRFAPEVGDDPLVTRALQAIHERFRERVSLPALTRALGTNRTTLSQRFHRATGLTVTGYLARLRVQFAAQLLHDTGLPVARVMERSGFQDPTSFSRVFKRETGLSPRAFRASRPAS
jgi:AraC-like DNA-binding protein